MDIYSQTIRQNIPLISIAIDFFLMPITNEGRFKEIQEFCIKEAENLKRPNAKAFIALGELSVEDFLHYWIKFHQNRVPRIPCNLELVSMTLRKLCEHGVFYGNDDHFSSYSVIPRYRAVKGVADIIHKLDKNAILNLVLGFEYICEKYKNSVFKVEHIDKNDDSHIGTGFYLALHSGNNVYFPIILTNKHVVEYAKKITIFTQNNEIIPYKKVVIDKKIDVAFLVLSDTLLNFEMFCLYPSVTILSDIISIGYPSVPLVQESYQLIHKGEINNSYVKDYWNNEFFLFSAKTSSGNSGGPILNKFGFVIGMTTQEFFDKEQFEQKGKPSYYAAIPSRNLFEALIRNAKEFI